MMKISDRMTKLFLVAYNAAAIARDILNNGAGGVTIKNEQDGSHHSLLTEADERSQAYLLGNLMSPDVRFLCEEEAAGPDVITDDVDLKTALSDRNKIVIIIDPVDGTAGASRQLADWGAAANIYHGGQFPGGVVVAPEVRRGGLSVIGDGEEGNTLFAEGSSNLSDFQSARVSACVDPKKAHVYLGVDILKRAQFAKFIGVVANGVQTAHVAGSCALGTALVSIGRSDAIVQPAQWVWDWATAPSLILPAGGKVLYYHYRQGNLVLMDRPDTLSFSRDKSQRIGFIAGAPAIVDWLWSQLKATFVAG